MPWDCLHSLFADMGTIDDNYLLFYWAIWCHYYSMLNDHIKYYATNILKIKNNKIDVYELTARIYHMGSLEKNMIE